MMEIEKAIVYESEKVKILEEKEAVPVTMGGDHLGDPGSEIPESDIVSHEAVQTVMVETKGEKQPRQRRVLHFSDGIVEEFSDEDEYQVDSAPAKLKQPPVDPKTLTWVPWMMHQTASAGGAVLKVCDYFGESLANLFGITTPKYEYEIEEYKRTMKQELEHKEKEDLEMGGWRQESTKKEPNVEAPVKTTEDAERFGLRVSG